MESDQRQEVDFVLMAEINIQLRITVISKMIKSIVKQLEEIEELFKIVNSKKRWIRL